MTKNRPRFKKLLECDRLWEVLTIAANGLSLCIALYWLTEVGSAALSSAAAFVGLSVFLQTKSEFFLEAFEELIKSSIQRTVNRHFYHEAKLCLSYLALLIVVIVTSFGSSAVGEDFLQQAKNHYQQQDYYHAQINLDKAIAFRQNKDACPLLIQGGIDENGFQRLTEALVKYEKAMNCPEIEGALSGINALRIRAVQDLLGNSEPLRVKQTVAFGERLEEAFPKYKVDKDGKRLKGLLLKWLALAYINDDRIIDAAKVLKESIELGAIEGNCLKGYFPGNYWQGKKGKQDKIKASKICVESLKNTKGQDIKGFLEINEFRKRAKEIITGGGQ